MINIALSNVHETTHRPSIWTYVAKIIERRINLRGISTARKRPSARFEPWTSLN